MITAHDVVRTFTNVNVQWQRLKLLKMKKRRIKLSEEQFKQLVELNMDDLIGTEAIDKPIYGMNTMSGNKPPYDLEEENININNEPDVEGYVSLEEHDDEDKCGCGSGCTGISNTKDCRKCCANTNPRAGKESRSSYGHKRMGEEKKETTKGDGPCTCMKWEQTSNGWKCVQDKPAGCIGGTGMTTKGSKLSNKRKMGEDVNQKGINDFLKRTKEQEIRTNRKDDIEEGEYLEGPSKYGYGNDAPFEDSPNFNVGESVTADTLGDVIKYSVNQTLRENSHHLVHSDQRDVTEDVVGGSSGNDSNYGCPCGTCAEPDYDEGIKCVKCNDNPCERGKVAKKPTTKKSTGKSKGSKVRRQDKDKARRRPYSAKARDRRGSRDMGKMNESEYTRNRTNIERFLNEQVAQCDSPCPKQCGELPIPQSWYDMVDTKGCNFVTNRMNAIQQKMDGMLTDPTNPQGEHCNCQFKRLSCKMNYLKDRKISLGC